MLDSSIFVLITILEITPNGFTINAIFLMIHKKNHNFQIVLTFIAEKIVRLPMFSLGFYMIGKII